jgi:hypothetical protein
MFGRGKDKKSFADRIVEKAIGDATGAGSIGGLGALGSLTEAVGALGGDARPQSLGDHSAMAAAKATIVADEGYSMAKNSQSEALQHQKYIVDIHPDSASDPAFRTEVVCWISWPDYPGVGDVVSACYTPGTKEAILLLAGDARFDWQLRRSNKAASDAESRDALLNAPPDSPPPSAS